jgi:hypothetical protein
MFLYSCIIILHAETRNRRHHCNTLYTHIYGHDGEPCSKLRLTRPNITPSFLVLSPPRGDSFVLAPTNFGLNVRLPKHPRHHFLTFRFSAVSVFLRISSLIVKVNFSTESRVVVQKNTNRSTWNVLWCLSRSRDVKLLNVFFISNMIRIYIHTW